MRPRHEGDSLRRAAAQRRSMLLMVLLALLFPALTADHVRAADSGSCGAGGGRDSSQQPRFREGIVLVTLESATPPGGALTGLPEVDAVLLARGATAVRPALRLDWTRNSSLKRRHGLDRVFAVELPRDAPIEEICAELGGLRGVVVAEPDAIGRVALVTPNDTHYPEQWHLDNRGQSLGGGLVGAPDADIDAPEGWELATGSGSVVLAVIDTGIDSAHPEFAGRILPGYDFVNNDPNPEADYPHGSEVAGLALANANNSLQIAGVDWAAQQLPLKAHDASGYGSTTQLVNAVTYAADHGADVVNMSVEGYPCSGVLVNAIQYALNAGVVLVASAGNGGIGFADTSGPGCIPGTISVGATNWLDARASYSATGAALDVMAPGDGVRTVSYHWYTDGVSSFSGTSAAAPLVAGLATLLRGADPTLTPGEVRGLIESNADDGVGPPLRDLPGRDDHYGWGRINLRETLEAVAPPRLRRGQALPRTLGVGASATFSVVYTSPAGNPPDFVRLVLESPAPATSPMTRSTSAHPALVDGDFTNGERYEATVQLNSTGSGRYHFECQELGAASRLPAAGALSGPRVTLIIAEDVAIAETSVASTINYGDYTFTHLPEPPGEDQTESVDEVSSGGSPSYSTLDHRWQFQITGGAAVTFFINAGVVSFWPLENDLFDFSYSTNGGASWSPMLTVSSSDPGESYQTFAMPAGVSGSVLVRAEDTDSTPGNTGNDRLFIDHMFFRSEAAPTPGEATDLRVTGFDPETGDLTLSWTPACAASSHNLVFGPLASAASYGYTGQICGLGAGGAYAGFDPGAGSFFFLVVGADGAGVEGSYGANAAGGERPQQSNDPSCPTTQNLTHRCDY